MDKLFGAQRLVLQAILDLPTDAAGFVSDKQVEQRTNIALSDIKNWIETLDGKGLVEVTRTKEGLAASITAEGRLRLGLFKPTPTTHDRTADSEDTPSSRLVQSIIFTALALLSILGISFLATFLTSFISFRGESPLITKATKGESPETTKTEVIKYPSTLELPPPTKPVPAKLRIEGNENREVVIVPRNFTGQKLRIWFYSDASSEGFDWGYFDLAGLPSIDRFLVGWSYFKVQNLDESDGIFLSNLKEKPYDVGWKQIEFSDHAVEIILEGKFSPLSFGSLNIRYEMK